MPWDAFKQMLATKSKVWGPSAYYDESAGTRLWYEAKIDMILDFGCLSDAEKSQPHLVPIH